VLLDVAGLAVDALVADELVAGFVYPDVVAVVEDFVVDAVDG